MVGVWEQVNWLNSVDFIAEGLELFEVTSKCLWVAGHVYNAAWLGASNAPNDLAAGTTSRWIEHNDVRRSVLFEDVWDGTTGVSGIKQHIVYLIELCVFPCSVD